MRKIVDELETFKTAINLTEVAALASAQAPLHRVPAAMGRNLPESIDARTLQVG